MIASYLRLAARLPKRVVAARALALGAGLAARPFRRAAALRRATYSAPPPGAPVVLLDGLPDLVPHRDWILPLAERHRAHRFDLLGSGWVRIDHGMAPAGAESRRHPPGRAVAADPAGAWLDGRINPANLARARAAWALIDGGYTPLDWQLDFKSGFRWREDDWFGDIRVAPEPGADIKVPWELARMQHLAVLAYAFLLTKDEAFAREARNQILDFVAQNPPGFGVNWRIAMEAAVRAANWIAAFELLRAAGFSFDAPFLDAFKASLLDHGRHVAANLERYPEGRANHYLADLAGLAFVAAWLPRDGETEAWLSFAAREMSVEILRQFNPDGSNFESSVCYHRLAAETAMFALAVLLGSGAEIPDLAAVAARLSRAGEFLRDLTKPSERMAQIGDNDSGRFFKFHPALARTRGAEPEEDSLDGRATLAALAALSGRADLARDAGNWLDAEMIVRFARNARLASETSRDAARAVRVAGSPPDQGNAGREIEIAVPGGNLRQDLRALAYPDFGVWLFRSRRLFLAVRCGEAARDGRGAHAHNDQLAIELAIDGEDWIADPGSYLYTADARLRNAYRSVAAHAAPRWPGREPGRLDLGTFWLGDDSRARCLVFADDRFLGEHFGFGARVAREVRVTDDAVIVRDFGLPGPATRQRLAGRAEAREFFKGAVPFSPGYGRQAAAP
ncbi:MAG: alginate lyase family protein [Rhodospirillales bacterium]|nr:alginate lyase family protein [Rhodospirillales bacterium]